MIAPILKALIVLFSLAVLGFVYGLWRVRPTAEPSPRVLSSWYGRCAALAVVAVLCLATFVIMYLLHVNRIVRP